MSPHPLEIAAVLCLAVVAFAYVGYPVLIWACSRLFGRTDHDTNTPADLPTVSMLIVAHNEEADIEARILNALSQDYPPEKLEIVIASDGSTDGTNEIVGRYADRGVRLLAFPENRGKAAALDRAVPQLTGEVVVLSDANTRMDRLAVRRFAERLADPTVGAVCGRLVLVDRESVRNADGVYWRYETFLKRCEGRLGALLGANGAIELSFGTWAGATPGVRVYSGKALATSSTLNMLASFTPAGAIATNGVSVVVRDINGDGQADLLTSSGEQVTAFSGSQLSLSLRPPTLFAFDPFPSVNGGVWIE